MQAELRRQNERLAEMVARDPLTGLYNRRYLMESLGAQLALAAQRGEPLSAALIDLDHFKPYNDDFGHQAGDAVLRRLGEVLQETVRGHDIVARFGGEEFVLILPGVDAATARELAERLRAAVAQQPWPLRPVTISLGIATTYGPVHDDGSSLLEAADQALYCANGRVAIESLITNRCRIRSRNDAPNCASIPRSIFRHNGTHLLRPRLSWSQPCHPSKPVSGLDQGIVPPRPFTDWLRYDIVVQLRGHFRLARAGPDTI